MPAVETAMVVKRRNRRQHDLRLRVTLTEPADISTAIAVVWEILEKHDNLFDHIVVGPLKERRKIAEELVEAPAKST